MTLLSENFVGYDKVRCNICDILMNKYGKFMNAVANSTTRKSKHLKIPTNICWMFGVGDYIYSK